MPEAVEEPYESSAGDEDGSEPGDETTTHSTLASVKQPLHPAAPTSTSLSTAATGLSPLSALASGLSSGPSPLQLLKPSPLAQLAALSHTPDVSPLAALSSSLKQQHSSNHADEEDYDT